MKRSLAILLFIFLFATNANSAGLLAVTSPTPTGGGDNYADLVFFWRCEALQMGVGDTYGTDSLATAVSSAAINTDAKKIGTNGLDIPTSDDRVYFDNNGQYVGVEGRFGAWIRVNTWAQYSGLMSGESGAPGTNKLEINLSGTDEISVDWFDSGNERTILVSTNANLATATWYFIEVAWKQSTNYREIFVDGVSKGSSSATLGAWSTAHTTISFGDYNGVVSGDGYHMDNIMLSNLSTRDLNALKNLTSTPKP